MREILKPCPFCGSEGGIAVGRDGTKYPSYRPYCRNIASCGCAFEWFDTEAEAIDAWNRRPEPKEIVPNKRIPGIGKCPACKQELCMDDENLHYCPTCGAYLVTPKGGKND